MGWTSISSRGGIAILSVATCYRNCDKLGPCGPPWLVCDFPFLMEANFLDWLSFSCVNDVATDGTTPLYLATQDGNLDCVKYLHSVGGRCDAKARDGMLPIHAAAQNGQLDCLGYLVKNKLNNIAGLSTTFQVAGKNF